MGYVVVAAMTGENRVTLRWAGDIEDMYPDRDDRSWWLCCTKDRAFHRGGGGLHVRRMEEQLL